MKTMVRAISIYLLFFTVTANSQAAEPKVAEVQKFFENYIKLDNEFNPQIAELYAANAVIQTTKHYPGGEIRSTNLNAEQFRALMRVVMPFAQQKGDKNSYSNITYTPEGDNVRINCQKFSPVNNYTSYMEFLVKKNKKGEWKIFAEETISKQ